MAADSAPSAHDRREAVVILLAACDQAFVESCIAPAWGTRQDLWIDVATSAAARRTGARGLGRHRGSGRVVVLSPDSLASRVCGEELAQAIALNKRIIPVLRRAVDDQAVPEALARPNWILAREEDDLDKAIAALVTAVETDEAWLSLHARLTQRTGEWLRADRDRSYVLRGSDLRAAEAWLAEQSEHAQSPTAEQARTSPPGAASPRARQRLLLGGVLVALGISIGWACGEPRAPAAESQSLAAQAIDATGRDPRAMRSISRSTPPTSAAPRSSGAPCASPSRRALDAHPAGGGSAAGQPGRVLARRAHGADVRCRTGRGDLGRARGRRWRRSSTRATSTAPASARTGGGS